MIPYDGDVSRVTLLDCGPVEFERVALDGEAMQGVTRGIKVRLPYALRGASPIAPTFRLEL